MSIPTEALSMSIINFKCVIRVAKNNLFDQIDGEERRLVGISELTVHTVVTVPGLLN